MSDDTTTVCGRRRRQIDRTSFGDITDAVVLDIAPCPEGTAVTFAAALTPEQVTAVERRMDSTGPDNELERSTLFADRDALAEDDPLRRLYDYVLGDE